MTDQDWGPTHCPHGVANGSFCEKCDRPADAQSDPADIIAGALQTSRAHAYELMEAALSKRGVADARPAPIEHLPADDTEGGAL